jgi:hypothetical protein
VTVSLNLPCYPFGEELHLLANYAGGLLKRGALNGPQSRQAQVHGLEAQDEFRKIDAGPQSPARLKR